MIPQEIYHLKEILDSFLGKSKKDLDETYQLQYPCIRCVANKGNGEKRKYNLEINLKANVYNSWCCAHDNEMHGSITKLIKIFGNEELLTDYRNTVYSLRQSKLFELSFSKEDFNVDKNIAVNDEVKLPSSYIKLENNGKYIPKRVMEYLSRRNISWDIIEKFKIGYTEWDETDKNVSNRIIIPSFNKFDELDYWTGRDFSNYPNKQKYFNPRVERKNLLFNEGMVNWDADITLVEGPFDHIVVPNSIPLLGKMLRHDFKLYQQLLLKCNSNINIFLDDDAYDDVVKIYSLLNHGNLYNRIRYIPLNENGLDPSKIYELWGKKGIVHYLRQATKINEIKLV